ncbi:MAG: hypothetical protein KGZ50_01190 [Peptococcaceae bacterium]|nr:hypothetical protein [Peptococcaceae bacterium]
MNISSLRLSGITGVRTGNLPDIAVIRGWVNYYGRFYKAEMADVRSHINLALQQWAQKKYKHLARRNRQEGVIVNSSVQMLHNYGRIQLSHDSFLFGLAHFV